MMYQNVPVPAAVDKVGGGYIGAQQAPQGHALGVEIVRRFGLKTGDVAIVLLAAPTIRSAPRASWAPRTPSRRPASRWSSSTRPRNGRPTRTSPSPSSPRPLQANPTAKVIVYPGGQELGNAATYMKAAGKKPGEIINVGFDTSPQIVEMFKDGWVQLTADQQPFQQGYLPILSLCEQIVYGLAPINVDTGAGYVTPDNYKAVADLAKEGLR